MCTCRDRIVRTISYCNAVIPSHARKNSNPPPIGRHNNNSTTVGYGCSSRAGEDPRKRHRRGAAPAPARVAHYTVYNIMYEYIIILYDII